MASPDLMAQFQGLQDQAASTQPLQQAAEAQVPVDDEPAEAPIPPQDTPATELVQFGPVKVDLSIADRAAEIARRYPSLKPVSGHRDQQANKRENGVDRSWHLQGRAIDFKGPAKDMYEAAALAQQLGAVEALVHNGGNGTILHVAWSD